MKYEDKLKQCDHEAKVTFIGLIATIIVWAVCGFGLSNLDIEIFQLPLWVVAGCFGTFLFAILFVTIFCKFIMRDVDLSDITPLDKD